MYDLSFNGALVVNTETLTSSILNVAVKDGKISAVSQNALSARREIDASGLVLAPGFVDVHSHVDGDAYGARLSVLQGITTSIGGNCGLSALSVGDYIKKRRKSGSFINEAMLIGHSFTLRKAVGIENVDQKATPLEQDAMEQLARKALANGAYGISLGLDYSPGAAILEIDTMAQLAAEYGRVLAVHTRLFTQNDLYSIYEILAAGKKSGARLLFSHFVYQYSGFGTLHPALQIMDEAREKGMDIWMDSGMYSDWATYIGTATFDYQTIMDNSLRFGSMVVATGKYTGQRLNKDLYLLLRKKYPNESVVCFSGTPKEVLDTIVKPYAMPSTDAGAYSMHEGHPQIAGSFPKYIRKAVRESGALSLEEAIYKATLLPCLVYNIPDKGIIKEGYDADIVLFNYDKIRDNAHFPGEGLPDAPPSGIPYVMINGALSVDAGKFTNTKCGVMLTK
ncbi:MAG: amidohydrolase family protein [Oscillospiraceae bacterium]